MTKLKDFVQERLAIAKRHPMYAEEIRHQAYGAVMYHIILHPEDTEKLLTYWDDFAREDFCKITEDYYR